MNSSMTKTFRKKLIQLPEEVQEQANKAFITPFFLTDNFC